jgi:rubrerythrin
LLNTTSIFIRFHGEFEDEIKAFYESLAVIDKYSAGRETFLTFIKENKKHKDMVLRTYREVITDALEAAFPLRDLNESDYEIKTKLMEDMSFQDVIKIAIEIEEKSYKYCRDAGESTSGLLADIPQAFEWVAKRKKIRIRKLEDLIARELALHLA